MIHNEEDFKTHILSCYPQEGCGYVMGGEFIAVPNTHPNPADNFRFASDVSLQLARNDRDYIVLHSHTMDRFSNDPRTPSLSDMIGQESTQVIWGIVHCDKESVTDILYFGPPSQEPLLNRTYINNVYDCFTLMRDYYLQELGIIIPLFPREPDWVSENPHRIMQEYRSLGFTKICSCEGLRAGDLLVYKIASQLANHIAIFIEGDNMMHHLHNKKSCLDSVTKWKSQFEMVLRYTG